MINQFHIISWDDALDDLEKAHVKAHFRRDPKTGKLHFIKNYDNKIHGKADHEIHAGTTMRINNPKSKHHGKVAEIKGYIVPDNPKKKPYVSCTVDGVRADLKPHHFQHVGSTPPTPAQAPTPAAATKKIDTLDEAKKELQVVGLSWNSSAMQHELHRVQTMSTKELLTRIDKIKDSQKLYNFYRVVENSSLLNSQDKAELADKIEKKFIEKANEKASQPAQGGQQAAKPAQAAQPAAQQKNTPPATSQAVKVGDIVEIQTGKYTGKKGKVTHMGGKYGVRVRVDLDGNGDYTKIAEYKKPHASFKGVSQPLADGSKSDNTRGKDKKKRKTRSDKGTGQPEEQKQQEKKEDLLDYANDGKKAYELAPDNYRDIAHAIGILPLDDDTRNMMDKTLHKMAKYYKNHHVNQNGKSVPKWVKYDHTRTSGIYHTITGLNFRDPDSHEVILMKHFLSAKKEDWEKNGWDYDKEIKEPLEEIQKEADANHDILLAASHPNVLNELFALVARINDPHGDRDKNPTMRKLQKQGINIDTPVVDALENPVFQEYIGTPVGPEEAMKYACVYANIDPWPGVTIRDVMRGLYNHKNNGGDPNDIRRRMAEDDSHKKLDELDQRSKNRSMSRYYSRVSFNGFEDAIRWQDQPYYSSRMSSSNDIFDHVLGRKDFPKDKYYNYSMVRVFDDRSYNAQRALNDDFESKVKSTSIFTPVMENLHANMIARNASLRYSQAGSWKPVIFDKDMLKDLGFQYAGLTAGRRKESTDINVEKLAAKYVKARKKKAKDAQAKKDKGKPETVKATMQKVDQKTHDYVVKRISETWDKSAHGSFGFKVHGVYQVGGMDLYDQFHKINKDRDNEQFCYHGTDVPAAANIIRSEFRIDRVKAGRMLGNGVYMTRTSSKASQYLGENFTRQRGTRGVLFVNKVSMGKVHDRAYGAANNDQSRRTLNGNHPDYHTADTVYAPKGKQVPGYGAPIANDEYLIRNNKAVLPMYWVDIELV